MSETGMTVTGMTVTEAASSADTLVRQNQLPGLVGL